MPSGQELDNVTAAPGNVVEFVIRASNSGNRAATQVIVRDTLPTGLTYQPGSTTIDDIAAADGIISGGLNAGDIQPGTTLAIRFRANVAPSSFFSNGTTVMTDLAVARGDNTGEVSDTASVTVMKGQGVTMLLSKLGRNVSRGNLGAVSPVNASPGETIEFNITVRNTSGAVISNLIVRDSLPQNISFVPGTVRANGSTPANGDALVTSGVNLGTLGIGAEILVTFQGKLAGASAFATGTSTLINTAYAQADGIGPLMAQLPVIVRNGLPPVVEVPTGPGESTLLALIVSAIITLLYIGYTSTDMFRRREVGRIAGTVLDDSDTFDFRR